MTFGQKEIDEIYNLLSELNSSKWERVAERLADEGPDIIAALLNKVESLKEERDAWMETARQESRNRDYYRGLLEKTSSYLGVAIFTQDDRGISESPPLSKVPELVKDLSLQTGGLSNER
jgi:DNA-binding GntR family transcriptional regulator